MRRAQRDKKRIVILCEGDTEEIAINHFVRRQWEVAGLSEIGLDPINLDGKLENVAKYARRYLQDPNIIAVFTLVDLYGMGRVQHKLDDDLVQKAQNVKAWFSEKLEDLPAEMSHRFHPHVAVHEIEAWLLADGQCLAKRLKSKAIKPDPHAETRNFEKPPSQRLKNLFKKHGRSNYYKLKDGTPLFKDVNFDAVYASCLYFKAFYDDLIFVAQLHLGD